MQQKHRPGASLQREQEEQHRTPNTLKVCGARWRAGRAKEQRGDWAGQYRMTEGEEMRETGHICHSSATMSQTTPHLTASYFKAELDILTDTSVVGLVPCKLRGYLWQWVE